MTVFKVLNCETPRQPLILPPYRKDILQEILQVRLNFLACRNDLLFFGAGGYIPHDHKHERFYTFLQFPNFLFNGRYILNQR